MRMRTHSSLPLFWRVFATHAALLLAAGLALALGPATISAPIRLVEAVILVIGIAALLVADFFLLRPVFAPLEGLAERMRSVDLLRPGQRLPASGGPELVHLVNAFNEMLDRLEAERHASGRRALEAQEAERKRIARGLHDEVGQVMTGVLLGLNAIRDAVPPDRLDELEDLQDAVRRAFDEVRRIARELRPETLETLGLESSLNELTSRFTRRTGVVVERRFDPGLPHLTPEAELTVYRVAQEALTNVARHAEASRVVVSLEHDDHGAVRLRITDDGRGLRDGDDQRNGGLRGMQERAVLAGGTLEVAPAPLGGVEIRLAVPANDEPRP